MLNDHEIRDREQIATLELLQITRRVVNAHSKIIMRHFSEAKMLLANVKARIDDLLEVIPEEEDE